MIIQLVTRQCELTANINISFVLLLGTFYARPLHRLDGLLAGCNILFKNKMDHDGSKVLSARWAGTPSFNPLKLLRHHLNNSVKASKRNYEYFKARNICHQSVMFHYLILWNVGCWCYLYHDIHITSVIYTMCFNKTVTSGDSELLP